MALLATVLNKPAQQPFDKLTKEIKGLVAFSTERRDEEMQRKLDSIGELYKDDRQTQS